MSKSENHGTKQEGPKGQSRLGKLRLVLWKNLILRRRHWILSAFELGIPTALMCLILFLRVIPDSKLLPTEHTSNTTFDPLGEIGLREQLCERSGGVWYWHSSRCNYPYNSNNSQLGDRRLFWGPPTPFTERMVKAIQEEIFFADENLQNVSTIDEMDDYVDMSYLEDENSVSAYYIGIFFNLEDLETDEAPVHLNYDLRLQKFWFTDYVYPFIELPGPRNRSGSNSNFFAGYNLDGFTILQTIIDRAFIREVSANSIIDEIKLEVEMYPYPPYVQDHGLSQFYGAVLPTFIILSLILLSPTLIKSIVHEKETGVRELLRMMGLQGWLIWLGWFMYSFIVIFLSSVIITFLMKVHIMANDGSETVVPPILVYSNGFLVFFFVILYGISAICFCFAVSCFFSKPTLATTIGVMLWLLTYFIPRAATDNAYEDMGLGPKLAICLLPNMAITFTFRVIGMFEGRAIGIQWNNLWETGNPRDQLAPAMILLMLTADIIIYIIITWYMDQVLPGVYGVPRPWYFVFQRSYWFKGKPERTDGNVGLSDFEQEKNPYMEPEPVGLQVGIKIKELRKEFKTFRGKIKVAVENVSLTCYKGQCTVLLGHNGAGKTTTMSMLTGVYSPTGGSAEVNGWNIKTNLKEARSEVGLCPQHNTLFTDLSVEQHLLFFARLKGLTNKEAKRETKVLLHRLDLIDKRDQFGGQLSGGMKRKLCLAIAIIGGSKIIILDEPSSGLDPESRRWVWDVIQKERGSRTVLVTTHHMEEADVLGDRVAIMTNGTIFCCGSSLFLKNTFGRGYTLSLSGQHDTDVTKLQEVISQYFTESTLESVNGNFYDFVLPTQTEKFAELLVHLSTEKEQLKINHIGLSLTTMEQVFLKVGELVDKSVKEGTILSSGIVNKTFESENGVLNSHSAPINSSNHEDAKNEQFDLEKNSHSQGGNESYREHKLKGNSLRLQRFRSLMKKKLLVSIRKWGLILTQSIIPVLVSIVCLVFDSTFSEENFKEPAIQLNLSMFDYSYSSLEYHDGLEGLAHSYMDLFHDPYKVNISNNLEETLLGASFDNLNVYRENYITSAQFRRDNNSESIVTRMMYQSIPYHPPGIGINMIDNALLHLAAGDEYSITANNAPLPANKKWQTDDDQTSYSAVFYATIMPLALSFLTSSFLVFPLQERISNAKQIQLMTGTPIKMLWFVTFFWDFLWYSLSALLIFIFFMLLDSKSYFTVDQAPAALFLLLILYGFGSIPMAYVFSFPFLSAASGFAFLVLVNITAGMIISSVTITLDFFGSEKLIHISNIIGNITSFVPSYPVSLGFLGIVEVSNYNRICNIIEPYLLQDLCDNLHMLVENSTFLPCCEKYCMEYGECFKTISYFQWEYPGIGMYLMFLAVDFFFYFLILYILEIGFGDLFLIRMWKFIRKISPLSSPTESDAVMDEDVARERAIAHDIINKDDQEGVALVVKDLTKEFVKTGTVAVDKISFHVKKGECFGLLGVNGAGKTTTFRMLTGDEIRTDGDARIGKNFLSHGRIQFMEEIGYCPQFDAIIDELTGEEMLSLMAGLRGVARWRQPELLKRLITLVDLTECAKRPSATYSGGNRRKLSTAMALVGQPPLVFLDEPTSGVDPASRRRVWEAVRDANRCGQSVILTSHSMDECEALCSNVVIMAKGVLKCAGTPKHLKAKFGKGYTLQVKTRSSLPQELSQSLTEEEVEEKYQKLVTELKATILSYFIGSTVTDEHRGMLAFKIPSTTSWQDIFNTMENLKSGRDKSEGESYHALIEDYAAMDPSLEQVFLSFAREREDGQKNSYKNTTKL